MTTSIKKILIANRGEIAVRIIRTAQEMGISTVAVYSTIDKNALHVQLADEAVHIGPTSATDSYLNQEIIIEACKKTEADAIHPGYGFLSENADFAQLVNNHGIIFIGPSSDAIRVMGDKLSAKRLAKEHNIPLLPGTEKGITDLTEAKKIAHEIGLPVLIKASAGGGGKGMRVVREASELEESMQRAMSEAESAFGNNEVFIEKFIENPRHIEFQILADTHGNTVHLFERECSIQRRHQKVIEEAPSPLLDEAMRTKMGDCAIAIAKACKYVGAGTIEFITDENNDFFFLEMNTRLQVEHPVTELITGLDLVKEQIRIAEGHHLPFQQNEIFMQGHAMELRVYAEDPYNNFLPDIGKITHYRTPTGPGIRVDDGVYRLHEISTHYDPMISKLVTYAADRTSCIQKMKRAIKEYRILGVMTTLPFGSFVMNNTHFADGNIDTNFVRNYFDEASLFEVPDTATVIAAAHTLKENKAHHPSVTTQQSNTTSNWKKHRS